MEGPGWPSRGQGRSSSPPGRAGTGKERGAERLGGAAKELGARRADPGQAPPAPPVTPAPALSLFSRRAVAPRATGWCRSAGCLWASRR